MCNRQDVQKSWGKNSFGCRKPLDKLPGQAILNGAALMQSLRPQEAVRGVGSRSKSGRAILGSPAGADGLKQFFPPSLEPPDETYILCLIFVYILVLIQEPKFSFTTYLEKKDSK